MKSVGETMAIGRTFKEAAPERDCARWKSGAAGPRQRLPRRLCPTRDDTHAARLRTPNSTPSVRPPPGHAGRVHAWRNSIRPHGRSTPGSCARSRKSWIWKGRSATLRSANSMTPDNPEMVAAAPQGQGIRLSPTVSLAEMWKKPEGDMAVPCAAKPAPCPPTIWWIPAPRNSKPTLPISIRPMKRVSEVEFPPTAKRSSSSAAAPTASGRASSSTTAAATRPSPFEDAGRSGHHGQFQPRDRFHRLRHLRPPLLRAA